MKNASTIKSGTLHDKFLKMRYMIGVIIITSKNLYRNIDLILTKPNNVRLKKYYTFLKISIIAST